MVDRMEMPPDLDRLYLTTAIGPNRVRVARHVRWVAPLGGMMQRALAEDLVRLLPGRRVLMPGDPVLQKTVWMVRVVVGRFMPVAPDHVVLDVDWFVTDTATSRVIAAGRAHVVERVPDVPIRQAAAMSRAITHLADILADHSSHPSREADVGCAPQSGAAVK